MHIWDQHIHAPELYCLTFGAEPASGLGQSSTADQPWMAHGANTMGPFKWSHIYIRWDVLSRELQNGSFRKTFELEYLEIFNKLWFYFSNNRGSPATILTQNYWVNSLEWTKSSLSFGLSPVIGLGLRLPRKKNRSHIQQHHKSPIKETSKNSKKEPSVSKSPTQETHMHTFISAKREIDSLLHKK